MIHITCLYFVREKPGYVALRSTDKEHRGAHNTPLHFPSLDIGINFLILEGFRPLSLHEVTVNDGSPISEAISKFLDVLPYSICWFVKEDPAPTS